MGGKNVCVRSYYAGWSSFISNRLFDNEGLSMNMPARTRKMVNYASEGQYQGKS